MFPLRDENPTAVTPWVTVAIIAANGAVWLFVQGAGTGQVFLESICRLGAIPAELTGAIEHGETVPIGPRHRCTIGGATWSTVLSSMFMHGGWGHIVMNMWFLWVFGNNIEDAMGHARFVVFYVASGALAAGAHIYSAMESGVPMVGASGAISGVMGAYVVLYPRVRVDTLFFFVIFIRVIPLPAWVMLGYWFLLQFVQGLAGPGASGGVAVWAHVGGFVAGLVLVGLFRNPERAATRRRRGGALW